MEEKLNSMSLTELREYAKEHGILHISSLRKQQLIDRIIAESGQNAATAETVTQTPGTPKPEAAQHSSAQDAQALKEEEPQRSETFVRTQQFQRPEMRQEQSRGEQTARSDQRRQGSDSQNRGRREYVRRDNRDQRNDSGRDTRTARYDNARDTRDGRNTRYDNTRDTRYETARDTRDTRYEAARENQDRQDGRENSYENTRDNREMREAAPESMPMELSALDSGNKASGVLEIMPDGYGFLRSDNYMSGENDVYVAPSQIRKFGLRTGDIISGTTRVKAQQERFSALLFVSTVNGMPPSHSPQRRQFENMTPIFADHRIRMERGSGDVAARIVDLIAPVGRGQRGMIVSPPKAGKTTLLKEIARSILANDPTMHIMIVLIDERPEEVTDIREAIVGERVEVLDSTFDEEPSHHIRVAQMGIERAKRLVEYGENVTILLDSITRLARASNLTVQPSGRTLSGGLDPAALHMPKRFFGAARNMREGGSLTILATALVDTGSKMDDMVFEEFKGTGNMELVLDRKLSERRVFPAIDIQKSSTRREDLLLTKEEQEAVYIMRKALNGMKGEEATENILNMFVHTKDNAELVAKIRRQRYV